MSARSTKKADTDTLRAEYSRDVLGPGVRGKYKALFDAGSNLVLLEPDVAEVFGSAEAVNNALRSLIAIAQKSALAPRSKPNRGPARASK